MSFPLAGNKIPSSSFISQAPTSASAGGEFSKFPKLPLELRRLVWKHVCHQSRFVVIKTCAGFLQADSGDVILACHKSSASTPALLHASKEAPKAGLESNQLLSNARYSYISLTSTSVVYTMRLTMEERNSTGPGRSLIYVNFDVDVICPVVGMDEDMFEDLFCDLGVEAMALNIEANDYAELFVDNSRLLRDPSVKRLIVYEADEMIEDGGHLCEVEPGEDGYQEYVDIGDNFSGLIEIDIKTLEAAGETIPNPDFKVEAMRFVSPVVDDEKDV